MSSSNNEEGSNSAIRCLNFDRTASKPAPSAATIEVKLRRTLKLDKERFDAKFGRLRLVPAKSATTYGDKMPPLPRFYWRDFKSSKTGEGSSKVAVGSSNASKMKTKRPLVQAKISDMFPKKKKLKLDAPSEAMPSVCKAETESGS